MKFKKSFIPTQNTKKAYWVLSLKRRKIGYFVEFEFEPTDTELGQFVTEGIECILKAEKSVQLSKTCAQALSMGPWLELPADQLKPTHKNPNSNVLFDYCLDSKGTWWGFSPKRNLWFSSRETEEFHNKLVAVNNNALINKSGENNE